jgi:UDP-GlcNAc:undecaprenyl-phosphate GlcNAc-1-phosphate transferase
MKMYFYLFITSFALSFLLTPLIKKIAIAYNILDYPDERKIHKAPIPLAGGVAIYISFATSILANYHFSLPLKGVVVGSTIIVLMGLIDDVRSMSATARLSGQVIAALILIRCGVAVTFLPNVPWGKAGEAAITILWVVGITNAFNFLDGLDGLATGLAAIAAGAFFVIALQTNQPYLGFLTIVLLGATLGFLPYNFNPAKIFLGDSGSAFLGFSLASLGVMGDWAEKDPLVSLSLPVLVLGVSIFDMIYITLSRIKHGTVTNFRTWIEYVGKDHFHHRLLNMGLTQKQAVLFIYAVSLCLAAGAIAITGTFYNGTMLLLFQATLIFLIISILMICGRRPQ